MSLYGKALKADSAAEWMEGAAVGGLFFRCQCLANRSACHLKLHAFDACLDDAGAALAALAAAPGDTQPLTLKLLARRGMALCQLARYEDAKVDYERALAIDPGNAQLQKDLATIAAMLSKCSKGSPHRRAWASIVPYLRLLVVLTLEAVAVAPGISWPFEDA